jgi:hypothetical protein
MQNNFQTRRLRVTAALGITAPLASSIRVAKFRIREDDAESSRNRNVWLEMGLADWFQAA